MIIFATILFSLLVLFIKACIIFFVAPIIMGFFIIIGGNVIRVVEHKKIAPIWWNILTVAVTVLSTSMLWKDITYEAYDYGFTPFLILIIYGISSYSFFEYANIEKINVLSKPEIKIKYKKIPKPKQKITTYTPHESRLVRVRKNLTVVNDVFEQCGISFKCNLVEEYERLQLNIELSNTKAFIEKYGKYTDFVVKANVYDKYGNLLCIEDVWFEYTELRQGYVADYFYFTNENMDKAHAIKVYAVIFNEDIDEDC